MDTTISMSEANSLRRNSFMRGFESCLVWVVAPLVCLAVITILVIDLQ